MEPSTFVFIGRSGCGKGTQAKLLMDTLKLKDSSRGIYYLQTGQRFRDFIKGDNRTNKISKGVYDRGERQPDFLAVWVWTSILVDEFNPNDHLIMDGCPRSILEAQMVDEAFKFYRRKSPYIIHIDVTREWSERHLLARGRMDDNNSLIQTRLNWYDRDVLPAVNFFKTDPLINYVEINGEQTIEQVHQEILSKLSSLL